VSNEPTVSNRASTGDAVRRTRLLKVLPWLWLGLSAVWAVVIFITDQLAWPLALWIATTVGPLTALNNRLDPNPDPQRSNR
jgi:hypothetical protein